MTGKRDTQALARFPFESPSKHHLGWVPFNGSHSKKGGRNLTHLQSADQLRPIPKSFVSTFGTAGAPQFNTLSVPTHHEAFESHLRPEYLRRVNNPLLSPVKFNSPMKDTMYGRQLLEPHAFAHRYLNTVSPNKMMMQDLASGQGNIGTPLRNRLDSNDICIGEYSTLKCEEILQQPKPGLHF